MTQAFNLAQFANNVNSAGQAAAGTSLTGTVPVANGGTNLATVPTNGQLLIGNGTGYTQAALTAGSNITITNGAGSVTVAATAAAPSTTDVLNATAGASVGAVGTYGFFTTASFGGGTPVVTFGNTTAGSGLRYAGAISQVNVGPSAFNFSTASAPSGTWRAMGDLKTVVTNCGTGYGGTLFLRIS